MISRDKALYLDGMIRGCGFQLSSIISVIKVYVHPDQKKTMIHHITTAMGELIEINNMLYEKYPDAKPEELKSAHDNEFQTFKYPVSIVWVEEKRQFTATSHDFPDCEAVGWTQLDAMKLLQQNIENKLRLASGARLDA